MRSVLFAAVLALLSAPAFAQTDNAAPSAAPGMTLAPAAMAPAQPDATTTTTTTTPSGHSGASHVSLDQRFNEANTTHDGHLTKDQAEAAGDLKRVVKHFDEMDADHKGYVTLDDIHKYYHARHATHRAKPPAKTEG